MKQALLYRICQILLHRLDWNDHGRYRMRGAKNIWPPLKRMEQLWVAEQARDKQVAAAAGYPWEPINFPAKFYRQLKKNSVDISVVSAISHEVTGRTGMTIWETASNASDLVDEGFEIRTWYGPNGEAYLAGVRGRAAEIWR